MTIQKTLQSIAKPLALSIFLGATLATSSVYLSSATAQVQPGLPNNTKLTAPTKAEARELIMQSKQQLRQLPNRDEIARIKNPRVRTEALRTYEALKRLAESDANNVGRVEMLYQTFDQAFLALESTAQASDPSEPKTCTFKCKEDGNNCQAACPKKFCGCKIATFGCIVAAWIHGSC